MKLKITMLCLDLSEWPPFFLEIENKG